MEGKLKFTSTMSMRGIRFKIQLTQEGNLDSLGDTSMEPLYPQNILERTFPILREQREKAEREASVRSNSRERDFDQTEVEYPGDALNDDVELYGDIPYEGGPAGRNLNTLA